MQTCLKSLTLPVAEISKLSWMDVYQKTTVGLAIYIDQKQEGTLYGLPNLFLGFLWTKSNLPDHIWSRISAFVFWNPIRKGLKNQSKFKDQIKFRKIVQMEKTWWDLPYSKRRKAEEKRSSLQKLYRWEVENFFRFDEIVDRNPPR